MKALTLHRPWPWAIFHSTKEIENRTWAPPAAMVGRFIAIHAGKTVADDAGRFIREVTGIRTAPRNMAMGIIGIARIVEVVMESPSPWFVGPVGWRLDQRIALPSPVPCKGAQGLWTVPPDIEALVMAGIAEAKTRTAAV